MKLEQQIRNAIRVKHYSIRSEECYVNWFKRYVRFHKLRHPAEMGEREVSEFLTYLAIERNVSASSQNQALSALLFLYSNVLEKPLGKLDAMRAKRPERVPVVLTRAEVARLLAATRGESGLLLRLLYGTGMRLMEGFRLRVKDLDFGFNTITIRDGKGAKDRVVMLPMALRDALTEQLERMKLLHEQDRAADVPGVFMPDALERKYPNAGKEWPWQWVFGARSLSTDKRSGIMRRHHLHENGAQKALKRAVSLAGITKAAHVHSLRHSAASHWLAAGFTIRQVQELLGHKNISTTMLYTHVIEPVAAGVRSMLDVPADELCRVLPFTLEPRDSDDADEHGIATA